MNIAYWLALMACSVCFLIQFRTTGPGDTAHNELGSFILIINQENAPQGYLQGNMAIFSQLNLLLSNDSSLFYDDKNPTKQNKISNFGRFIERLEPLYTVNRCLKRCGYCGYLFGSSFKINEGGGCRIECLRSMLD